MSTIVNNMDSATYVSTKLSPKLVLEAEDIHISINDVSIISDVSVVAHSGELFAIMGPSGSGKTTLLCTIAGRRSPQSGYIKLNGNVMDNKLRKRLGFVLQEDIFFASLTLKETLYFTSMIRLPESITRAEKLQQIDDLAEVLDVKKCLDTRMGDMFSPGLSGGEKKRASIICELLTNPDILLLDEPTSGLDSSTALALMQQLRKFADEKNKIIIFSIHQPSSQMYHMFDKLLLLAQGKVAFVGHRSDALMHLEQVGFECGIHYNPADFIMGILKSDESAIKLLTYTAKKRHATCHENELSPNRTSDNLTKGVTNEAYSMEETDIIVQIAARDSSDKRKVKGTLEETQKWPTSFSTQLRMLSWRTFKVSRGRILHLYELLQSMILAVLLGLVFYQIPHTIGSIRDRMGLLYVCVTYWTFAPAMDAISSFPSERGVVTKELAAKAYRVSAYYIAKSVTELPLVLILPVFYYTIAYWMSGLNGVPQFFASLCILLLNAVKAQGLGYMIGAACLDFKFAIFLTNTSIIFSLILSGFITYTLPEWFVWAKYMSFIFHPLSAMSLIVFQDVEPLPCDMLGATEMFPHCDTNTTVFITGDDILLKAGITLPVYCYIIGLVMFTLLFRTMALLAMKLHLRGPK